MLLYATLSNNGTVEEIAKEKKSEFEQYSVLLLLECGPCGHDRFLRRAGKEEHIIHSSDIVILKAETVMIKSFINFGKSFRRVTRALPVDKFGNNFLQSKIAKTRDRH
jgi:hypothetical protein